MKQKIFFLHFILPALWLIACGSPSHIASKKELFHSQFAPLPRSHYAGLVFSSVHRSYSQASIFYYDFATGHLRELLTEQSGDPYLLAYQQNILLFNRQPGFPWLLSFKPQQVPLTPTVLQKSLLPASGDPYKAVTLKNGNLLLAYFNKGRLLEVNPQTGQVVKTIKYQFANKDRVFRPADLFLQSRADKNFIYVIHRGLDQNYQPNGSQAILTLVDHGDRLKWLETGKHYKLAATYAQFLHTNSPTPIVAGLCYKGQNGCTAAIQRFNPSQSILQMLAADLSPLGLKTNGPLLPGFDQHSLIASVWDKASENRKVIALHFDQPGQARVYPLYDYTWQKSQGVYLLQSDLSNQTLFIGDGGDGNRGKLVVYKSQTQSFEKLDLPSIPYQGLLLPKS